MKSSWWHLTPHGSGNANFAGREHSQTGFVTAAETAELAGPMLLAAGWVLCPSREAPCSGTEQALQSVSVCPIMKQPYAQRTKDQWVFNCNCCFHTHTRLHNPPLLDKPSKLPEYFHSLCQWGCPPLSLKEKLEGLPFSGTPKKQNALSTSSIWVVYSKVLSSLLPVPPPSSMGQAWKDHVWQGLAYFDVCRILGKLMGQQKYLLLKERKRRMETANQ